MTQENNKITRDRPSVYTRRMALKYIAMGIASVPVVLSGLDMIPDSPPPTSPTTQVPDNELQKNDLNIYLPETHKDDHEVPMPDFPILGDEHSYASEGVANLVKEINSNPETLPPKPYEQAVTFFVTKKAFDNFESVYEGMDAITFLKRHVAEINKWFDNANLMIDGEPMRMVIRRAVVITDTSVDIPDSYYDIWINHHINDSNGTYLLDLYDPKSSYYWDPHKKIDRGYPHELGHDVTHLNDLYACDYEGPIPNELSDLPFKLRIYHYSFKDNAWMANSGDHLSQFVTMQLKNRIHSPTTSDGLPGYYAEVFKDYYGWPPINSEAIELAFKYQTGIEESQPFNISQVEIYKTTSPNNTQLEGSKKTTRPLATTKVNYEKVLTKLTDQNITISGNSISVNPANIFTYNESNGYINEVENTILLKLTGEGHTFYRWMDVTDFKNANWMKYSDGSSANRLEMLAFTGDENVEFDKNLWRIDYSHQNLSITTTTR